MADGAMRCDNRHTTKVDFLSLALIADKKTMTAVCATIQERNNKMIPEYAVVSIHPPSTVNVGLPWSTETIARSDSVHETMQPRPGKCEYKGRRLPLQEFFEKYVPQAEHESMFLLGILDLMR